MASFPDGKTFYIEKITRSSVGAWSCDIFVPNSVSAWKRQQCAGYPNRAFCSAVSALTFHQLHRGLCHPGVARLLHFVRSKNLPFSTEDVKRVCSWCRICAEIKPQFYVPEQGTLIKATKRFERLILILKGLYPPGHVICTCL